MVCCLIKIVIKPYKHDEFVQCVHSLTPKIRQQRSCLDYSVYQDFEKENTYCMVGEWKTHQALEQYFQTREFEVLLGAARVLGESFAMEIVDVLKTGGYELAREQRTVGGE